MGQLALVLPYRIFNNEYTSLVKLRLGCMKESNDAPSTRRHRKSASTFMYVPIAQHEKGSDDESDHNNPYS